MDGLRLVEALRSLRPAMRIIVISGYYLEDDARVLNAMRESRIDGSSPNPFKLKRSSRSSSPRATVTFTRDRGRAGPHLGPCWTLTNEFALDKIAVNSTH